MRVNHHRPIRLCISGRLTLTVVGAVAGLMLVAGPASAITLDPSPDPLPGSSFQGGDGDQDDAGQLLDWQALAADGGVAHSPDPDEADSAFKGGSKENKPGDWDLTTEKGGVNPSKANILDTWSAVDQLGGETFLHLAFRRASADGTTYLAFELNQASRLWNNGRAKVPCRTTGDVLIAYEPQGREVTVEIQRWTTTEADPATGCAASGKLETVKSLDASTQAQGALNQEQIASYLPGAGPGTIPSGEFGEASLNLAEVLGEAFGDDCLSFGSVWMHSRSSDSDSSNMQDYVEPSSLPVRTCTAAGRKFFDADADGVRDEGERGIPRFLVWADYNDDGVRQDDEPFSITDVRGRYVIYDIEPPDGTYSLRESLMAPRSRTRGVASDWICSFPNDQVGGGTGSAPNGRFPCAWGSIDVETTPNATGRDFGNWFPTQLTLEKELEPAGDPGRFDLLVDGEVVEPGAGDGASRTLKMPPGTYDVSEVAVPPTDAADYSSTTTCRRLVRRAGEVVPGTAFEDLVLKAGQRAVCTFRNVRPGEPAIAIAKTGPTFAKAGDTLRYGLLVTNPGDIPFPASAVEVDDPDCENPPRLVRKRDGAGPDGSPSTLDPGDGWTYRCVNSIPSGGSDCKPARVENTASVTVDIDGTAVADADSTDTIVLCPGKPRPPIPVPPSGGPSNMLVPPGPRPPDAGDPGKVSFDFNGADRCISGRVPRLEIAGTRIESVEVYVDGRLVRDVSTQAPKTNVTPRIKLDPGRHRITVRIDFQPGSGTPPVTLKGTVRVCRPFEPPQGPSVAEPCRTSQLRCRLGIDSRDPTIRTTTRSAVSSSPERPGRDAARGT